MEPLIILLAVTLGVLVVNGIWIRRPDGVLVALRAGILAMFVMTGTVHFVGMRAELIDMVPEWMPLPELIVTITGVLELAGALAMFVRPLVPWAGTCLSLLLLAMFPANVSLALSGGDLPWWDELVPRSAAQAIFLAATVGVTLLALRARRRLAGASAVSG